MSRLDVVGHRRSPIGRPNRGSQLPPLRVPDEPAPRLAPPTSGRRGTIRSRLAGILALPLMAVLALVGIIAFGQVQGYRTATSTTDSVELVLEVQDLVQELQTERGLTAGLLGGNVSFKDELPPARALVDQRREAVLKRTEGRGAVERRVRQAVVELDALAGIRVATDSGTAERGATFAFFTDRIATLTGVDYGLSQAGDRALARGLAALEALGEAKESTAQERAFLNGVYSAGGFTADEFAQFAAMRAEKKAALARFDQFATPRQRQANAFVFDTGSARTAAYFEQVALDAADGRNVLVNPQSWWSALTTVLDDMRQLQQHIGGEIRARAQTLQNEATWRLGALGAVLLISFVGALLLLFIASRSITRPLAALAAEADGLASQRLPEAVRQAQRGDTDTPPTAPPPVRVPARASSEIRSVADALDRVQATAYALATEQAMLRRHTTDSMANLGRRNQSLLRRQLGFISELEREETDPVGLANLFELDHLATRMRRNAESLLVLAGVSTPRQWSAPMPIAEVIRAATAEVEEYRRVTMRRIDDAQLSGSVLTNVAHMLAELIENGLQFSPPDSTVEIEGRQLPQGYLIAIIDQGIGMSADELSVANARLRSESEFLSEPTRFLGHSVVGHLARQMDIDVHLVPSPVTGITARVILPDGVMAGSAAPGVVAPVPAVASIGGVEYVEPVEVTSWRDRRAARIAAHTVVTTRPEAVRGGPGTVTPVIDVPTQQLQTIDRGVEHVIDVAWPPVPVSTAAPQQPRAEAQQPPPPEPTPGPAAAPAAVPAGNGSGGSGGEGRRTIAAAGRPAGGGSGGVGGVDGSSEWTVNGLRRRPPRNKALPAEPTPAQRPEDAYVDHSPAEVRSRLTSLRAGVQRGEAERHNSTEWEAGQHDR